MGGDARRCVVCSAPWLPLLPPAHAGRQALWPGSHTPGAASGSAQSSAPGHRPACRSGVGGGVGLKTNTKSLVRYRDR